MDLQGKRALVTGGGRGIGRGIALALAAQGCAVAINYVRRRAEAEETAAAARAFGVQAAAIRANVGAEEEMRRLVEVAAVKLGGLDIFVGNAASGVLRPALEVDARAWDWTLNINARSLLVGAQAAVPHMRQGGWGRVVAVSSLGGRRVVGGYTAVGVSKAALEALVRYLAADLAREGIVVNAVSPGLVETSALDFFPDKVGMLEQARRVTPAGRLATPEDVGGVVAWLCTDAAAMIVGQVIEVDGGYSLMAGM
jgi:enoyl-[acyl-carrier protein] reductase III